MHIHSLAVLAAFSLALSLAAPASGAAATAEDLGEVTRLHHAGQTAAALARADKVLAAQPKDAQMRFLKSVVLADAGRGGEAVALLTTLTQDYPELAEPHNNLAVLHAGAGEHDKARLELEVALRLRPDYATARENLGDVYVQLARRSYATALDLEPASTSLPRKLALVSQLSPQPERSASAPPAAAGETR